MRACLTSIGQYSVPHTARSCVQTAMTLSHVPELLRLRLQMTSKAAADFNMEASVIKVIKGMMPVSQQSYIAGMLAIGGPGSPHFGMTRSMSDLTWHITCTGLQFLAHLQHLRIDLEDGSAGQLQSVLEVCDCIQLQARCHTAESVVSQSPCTCNGLLSEVMC